MFLPSRSQAHAMEQAAYVSQALVLDIRLQIPPPQRPELNIRVVIARRDWLHLHDGRRPSLDFS